MRASVVACFLFRCSPPLPPPSRGHQLFSTAPPFCLLSPPLRPEDLRRQAGEAGLARPDSQAGCHTPIWTFITSKSYIPSIFSCEYTLWGSTGCLQVECRAQISHSLGSAGRNEEKSSPHFCELPLATMYVCILSLQVFSNGGTSLLPI